VFSRPTGACHTTQRRKTTTYRRIRAFFANGEVFTKNSVFLSILSTTTTKRTKRPRSPNPSTLKSIGNTIYWHRSTRDRSKRLFIRNRVFFGFFLLKNSLFKNPPRSFTLGFMLHTNVYRAHERRSFFYLFFFTRPRIQVRARIPYNVLLLLYFIWPSFQISHEINRGGCTREIVRSRRVSCYARVHTLLFGGIIYFFFCYLFIYNPRQHGAHWKSYTVPYEYARVFSKKRDPTSRRF